MAELFLKPGREKSVLRHHPWIFSGAVARINGAPAIGETVDILSSRGELLAKAAYNLNSNIVGRIWTWDINEPVDINLLANRINRAIETRRKLINFVNADAMRLIHAESDGLPGLILDQYHDTYVIQFLAAAVEFWKEKIIELILSITNASLLYERSDVDVRELEGLPLRKGVLFGRLPEDDLIIKENEIKFLIDIIDGHKTGFYLDQKDNRLFARMISDGAKVLDCFSYTGGFALNTLVGGAQSVTLVDSSAIALDFARRNLELNNFHPSKVNFIEQDVFKYLRTLRDTGETYDLVILDPPKFAPTSAQAERAARGYKDINLLAIKILKPGGYMLTFSCSGGISEDLFQKIVASAALDAGVDAIIIKRLHQAIDHPVALNFPEGAYLKGFLIQRIG